MKKSLLAALFGLVVIGIATYVVPVVMENGHARNGEVNIYSYRQEILIRPLLDAFTEQSGIKVNLVSGRADALLERLKSEGANSPADVLLTVDAGRLIRAKDAGVFQSVKSLLLEKMIPARYRDPEGFWFGLSMRSRVIFFAPNRASTDDLSTYEDLTNLKWRGRICVRSSSNVYNQSLLASMIAHSSAEAAENWARSVVANMARKPQGGDRDQIKAVAAGQCDIAIANTYYYARMLNSKKPEEAEAASKVTLFWPNQNGRGAHVNISGAGVTSSAKNRDNAIKLIEFLVSDEAQRIYAESTFEYPIKDGVPIAESLAALGDFKSDVLDIAVQARHNADALKVFDRADWR